MSNKIEYNDLSRPLKAAVVIAYILAITAVLSWIFYLVLLGLSYS